jgi:hypothetical protein
MHYPGFGAPKQKVMYVAVVSPGRAAIENNGADYSQQ